MPNGTTLHALVHTRPLVNHDCLLLPYPFAQSAK